jgi:hypothetical protein
MDVSGLFSAPQMDRLTLSKTMKEVTRRTDAYRRPADFIQHQFARAPFGSAYACISPGEQGQYASSNHNRLHLCGTEPGLTADGTTSLLKLFGDAGIVHYFVWISPGPDIEVVRRWLADAGLTRRPHVSYLTLAQEARDMSNATPEKLKFSVAKHVVTICLVHPSRLHGSAAVLHPLGVG